MTHRSICLIIAFAFAALAVTIHAREQDRVPVVGLLMISAGPQDPVVEALRSGLHELGYMEGRDFRFEHRRAEGRVERLQPLAEELVRLDADVIVTGTNEATLAAKRASDTIPIVAVLYDHDPVASGLINSFSRPGGAITGLTARHTELAGKRLELLKETVPNLKTVAVFADAFGRQELSALKAAAPALGVQLYLIELKPPYDLDGAFSLAKQHGAGGVMVLTSSEFYIRCSELGALALKNRTPVSSSFHCLTRAGGLMSYSTDPVDGYHRAAYFVDRLLKGVPVSDLPFETTNPKFIVNLKTAKALKVILPQTTLLRADEVVR